MAPAANARAYGRIGCARVTAQAPRTPATGSTMPLSWPYLPAGGKDETGCHWVPLATVQGGCEIKKKKGAGIAYIKALWAE